MDTLIDLSGIEVIELDYDEVIEIKDIDQYPD